jgi:hypothetical protein
MLSLEGFEFEDEEETLDEADEEESGDMVRDLRPIRIPSNDSRSYNNAMAHTPSSVDSAIEEIVTPTSASGSPLTGMRLAGSSPPRKAPIGTSGNDLGRKGSKWRRSMMGLSDVRARPRSHCVWCKADADRL